MQKLTLHLPKYRLNFQFALIKKRKSALDEPLIPTKKVLNLKYRVGGLTRKFFRHIFEHKTTKRLLGANIAFVLIASTFVPTSTFGSDTSNEVTSISNTDMPIHTNISIQDPVKEVHLTQGFRFFHPGLDIDGSIGDPIRPIKNGTVEFVEYSKFGYGKHVIVNHGNGLKSLYAHLSKINVQEGDSITTDTILGEMGSTGHSTGDHLHLEVRENGFPINPLSVLPK